MGEGGGVEGIKEKSSQTGAQHPAPNRFGKQRRGGTRGKPQDSISSPPLTQILSQLKNSFTLSPSFKLLLTVSVKAKALKTMKETEDNLGTWQR